MTTQHDNAELDYYAYLYSVLGLRHPFHVFLAAMRSVDAENWRQRLKNLQARGREPTPDEMQLVNDLREYLRSEHAIPFTKWREIIRRFPQINQQTKDNDNAGS
jgi:hypothetical protein